jgi:hypothetical protein
VDHRHRWRGYSQILQYGEIEIMEKAIPEKYEALKISLAHLGVCDFAWSRDTVLDFLKDPLTASFAVLGGDVLSVKSGVPAYNYDSWSMKARFIGESFEDYCARSRDLAIRYIELYPTSEAVLFSPWKATGACRRPKEHFAPYLTRVRR